MSKPELSLVVIRSQDLERSSAFYRALGLPLIKEQHGSGPLHYAAELGRMVFEIYPLGNRQPTTDLRLGFIVDSLESSMELMAEFGYVIKGSRTTERGLTAIVRDPDGHTIELTQSSND